MQSAHQPSGSGPSHREAGGYPPVTSSSAAAHRRVRPRLPLPPAGREQQIPFATEAIGHEDAQKGDVGTFEASVSRLDDRRDRTCLDDPERFSVASARRSHEPGDEVA